LERTDRFGKDRQIWKGQTGLEGTVFVWKGQKDLERTERFGKDGQGLNMADRAFMLRI
jgi:hypothetical protein